MCGRGRGRQQELEAWEDGYKTMSSGQDLKGTAAASGDSVGGGQMIEVEHRKIFYIYLQLYIFIKYTTY